MQAYPRAPDLVWPGHLHGTGCLSARAVGTGFPTVGLRLWLGPGCGWSWVLFAPARCGWGLGWVCLGSVCGVVPLLPAVCGVRGWALVSACFRDLCGFVRVSLAPAVSGSGVRCGRACWARVSAVPRPCWLGCRVVFFALFCFFFFFSRCWVSLSWALWSLPPSPFFRAGLLASFFFFFCLFWCPFSRWAAVPGLVLPVLAGWSPCACLGVLSSVPSGWGVWPPCVFLAGGVVAVGCFAQPPPPPFCFFFFFFFWGGGWGGAAWLFLPLPSLGWRLLCGWCVVWLVPRHSWRRFPCATPRHSWLGFAAGGGGRSPPLLAGVCRRRWCVVCGVGVLVGLWLLCGVVGPSPLLAEVPMCYSPPLLAGFRCRWWWAVPADPGWGLAAVVCGVWCVAVVCWWGCGWCVVWLVPRHSWRRFLCATPRHSWLGFAAAGGGRSPPLLAGVRLRRWCVVCGGGVLLGLWLLCGVVGPSPLLAEVPVCYSPPLLAGFRCRWWWAVPATPGWGLAAVVCGVWCVAVVCWWGCGWCVVWLVPRHSWRRFLCATPRHSWLGFAAAGGGRSPPLLAGVLRRWCVVCGVWRWCVGGVVAGVWCGWSLATPGGGSCVLLPATPGWVSLPLVVGGPRHSWLGSAGGVGVWCVAVVCCWGCGWCVVWLVPRHSWRRSLCATPRHSWLGFAAAGGGRSPPLLAGDRWRRGCVVCGVLLGSLATPGGGSCVLLPATPGWVSLPLVVGGPRHSWLGSAGGGGVRALLGWVGLLCLSALLGPLRVGVAPLSFAAVAVPRWLGFAVCGLAVAWHLFVCPGSLRVVRALRVCGTRRPSLLGTCPCALVVAGGVPLWRASWPRVVRRASSGPVALGAPVGFPDAVVPFPTPVAAFEACCSVFPCVAGVVERIVGVLVLACSVWFVHAVTDRDSCWVGAGPGGRFGEQPLGFVVGVPRHRGVHIGAVEPWGYPCVGLWW